MVPDIPLRCRAILSTPADAQVGDIVVVQLNDRVLCKRLAKRNGAWVLSRDREGYTDVTVHPSQQAKLVGVVEGVYRRAGKRRQGRGEH